MLINLAQQLSVHHLLTPLTDLQRHALPVVSSNRLLSVIVYNKFSWEDHFRHMVGKVGKKIGAFYRAKRLLNGLARKMYFTAVILPDLNYCCPLLPVE